MLIFITLLVAIGLATCAAYISIFGFLQVFAGASPIVIAVAGSFLEAGKLTAASFVYRKWDSSPLLLRMGLIIAVLVLILITSAGIFGYLSSAYQKESLTARELTQRVEIYQSEYDRLLQRRQGLDAQISNLPADFVTARQRLLDSFTPEYETIDRRIEELSPLIYEIKLESLNNEAKLGPIFFVANELGYPPEKAVFIFILALVLVFDPLAVMLTIAANSAIKHSAEEKKKAKESPTTDNSSNSESVLTLLKSLGDEVSQISESRRVEQRKKEIKSAALEK